MNKFLICECCNQTYLEEDMSKNNKNMCCSCWCYTRPKDKRIAELEKRLKNAIVLPFEFDKPFYKLCPKCNNQQEGCKNCAWQMCGFNQCFSICHSENEGLLIKEIILKKDNCIVSLNALNYIIENWNKYYFATKEEAQVKLEELQGENK